MSFIIINNKILSVNNKKISTLSSGITYEPELTTYISGLVTPLSDEQKGLLNTMILSIKTGMNINALSDAFDYLHILAGETEESSLRNLVKRSFDCTKINSPSFTQYEGYSGDANVKCITTNFTPSTNAVAASQDNNGFGVYIRTSRAYSGLKRHGAYSGSTYTYVYPLATASSARSTNNGSSTNSSYSTSVSRGLTSSLRYGSDGFYTARNKSIGTMLSSVSTGMVAVKMWYMAANGLGTYDEAQIAWGWYGKALSQAELNVLFDAVETYLDARGKGVV